MAPISKKKAKAVQTDDIDLLSTDGDEGSPVKKGPQSRKDLIESLKAKVNTRGKVQVYNLGDGNEPGVKYHVPTGIMQIDKLLKGGLPSGRIIEVWGLSGSGKTHFALNLSKAVIQDLGGVFIYNDVERGVFDPEYLKAMNLPIYDSSDGFLFCNINVIEEAMDAYEKYVKHFAETNPDMPIVIVHDTMAMSKPKAVFETEWDELSKNMMLDARIWDIALSRFVKLISDYNVLLILLNQARANFGASKYEPAYKSKTNFSAQHAISLSIEIQGKNVGFGMSKYRQINGSDQFGDEQRIGSLVTAKFGKSRFCSETKVDFELIYGKGFREGRQILEKLRSATGVISSDKYLFTLGTKTFEVIEKDTKKSVYKWMFGSSDSFADLWDSDDLHKADQRKELRKWGELMLDTILDVTPNETVFDPKTGEVLDSAPDGKQNEEY